MKVKIFVDWVGNRIMNQAEGEKLLASQISDQESYEDYRGEYLNDILEDWLKGKKDVSYSEFYKKLFDLTAEERAEVEELCRAEYKEQIESDFFSDWDEVWVEV